MDIDFGSINIGLGVSPDEFDIAIVSVDGVGRPGMLNSLVLKAYGYSEKELPKKDMLYYGFSILPDKEDRKKIICIVTVNEFKTSENLEENLYNALIEFRELFSNKKIWVPLMGTGAGGLSLEESFLITNKIINLFKNNDKIQNDFLISIPDTNIGNELFKKISKNTLENKTIIDDAEIFFKSLDVKLYLVGSYWSGEDQTERFVNEGIWENGYGDEKYSSLIKSIKINDILVIKSTFNAGGISYLRLKAVGIVIENKQDGAILKVDWKIKEISEDIENYGYFRNTVQQVKSESAKFIISRIEKKYWNLLRTQPITSKETIAGLVSDSEKGIDYLEISKDINAFSRVISAKSFEPPLAIALFGKWGSGKSFFMLKLKEQIIKLSDKKNGIYCEGIAHIHFNAWSYMDSNLWASIVTKIFEELNEYILENKKENIEKENIEKQLTNDLTITKEEIGKLENQKNLISQQIKDFEQKREELENKLNEHISKVKSNTIWDSIENANKEFNAKEKILNSLNENLSYLNTVDELKKIIPEKYWSNPEKTYQLANSRITFLKEFFRKDKIKTNLIWLTIFLTIIAFIPIFLELLNFEIENINFLLPQTIVSILITCGAFWKRAETVFNKLQPIISSFWMIKEEYQQKINEAISKNEQEEKVLKIEIEKGNSELLMISEQIQKAESIKADLDFRIKNALSTETLYSFIDKRSKSEDYKKHLGIISVIRRDFEILNSLFSDHNKEVEKINKAKEFKKKFKKPLERIILYIDDLDRCPEENVVQVLEAVNLLMAFPLFVVIVGVDSRWVKNALIKKYSLQFTGKLNENETINSGIEMIEPSNYLEKIFQVPFHLKEAKDLSIKEMIKKLAEEKANIFNATIKDNKNDENIEDINNRKNSNEGKTNEIIKNTINSYEEIMDKPEALILSKEEIIIMQDMSEVIGNNPRAIKRFVNVFRIIRAHEEFIYSSKSNNQQLIAVLFILALSLGVYRKLLTSFEDFIQNEKNSTIKFNLYLQPTNNIPDFEDLKSKLNDILSEKESFKLLKDIPVSLLEDYNSFIKRFTFN